MCRRLRRKSWLFQEKVDDLHHHRIALLHVPKIKGEKTHVRMAATKTKPIAMRAPTCAVCLQVICSRRWCSGITMNPRCVSLASWLSGILKLTTLAADPALSSPVTPARGDCEPPLMWAVLEEASGRSWDQDCSWVISSWPLVTENRNQNACTM